MLVKRPLKIISYGTYLPENKILASDVDQILNLPQGTVEEKTKIKHRYHANETETNSFMGAQAIKSALDKQGMNIDDLDLIISASGSKEQMLPYLGALIHEQLCLLYGKQITTPSFDVDTSCLSFVTALEMASHLIQSNVYKKIAIVSAEVASIGLNKNHFESFTLFGDGAAAVIIEQDPYRKNGIIDFNLRTYSKGAHSCEVKAGGTKFNIMRPPEKDEDYLFSMNGKAAYRTTCEYLPDFLAEFFSKTEVNNFSNVDLVVPHQASPLGLHHIQSKLGLSEEKIVKILHERGNQIAASIPFALIHALDNNRIKPGDKVMLFGTSAGLSIGALLLQF